MRYVIFVLLLLTNISNVFHIFISIKQSQKSLLIFENNVENCLLQKIERRN